MKLRIPLIAIMTRAVREPARNDRCDTLPQWQVWHFARKCWTSMSEYYIMYREMDWNLQNI